MGTMRLCRGDLFRTTSSAIAHGCNVKGAMGAGIALDIKRYFPDMYEDYNIRCTKHEFAPGDIFISKQRLNRRDITVYNLMTQTGFNGADIQFMQLAFEKMFEHANANGITEISIPMIGAGLGGISPSVCFNIYLEAIEKFNGRLNVIVQYAENIEPYPIMDDSHDMRNTYKRAYEAAKTKKMREEVQTTKE